MRELALVITLWISTLFILYSPLMFQDLKTPVNTWLIVIALTLIIPQFINMAARGYGRFNRFAIDYNFMFTASLSTFLIFIGYIQNKKLKKYISSFGKDIESTGVTLGLLIPTFVGGLMLSYKLFRGAMYLHYLQA